MVDIRKTRTCEKCNTQVPLDKVKLYPKANDKTMMICESCLDRLKNAAKTTLSNVPKSMQGPLHNTPKTLMGNNPTPSVQKSVVKNIIQAKKNAAVPEGYQSVNCTRCNYNFKIDKDRANVYFKLVCPYCGKDDRLNPKKLR